MATVHVMEPPSSQIALFHRVSTVVSSELSLDNPAALKVPFGVAVSIAVLLFAIGHLWGIA